MALLHCNWVILYLRTCSNPIGPFSKSLLICDWTILYLWTTCTNVMSSFFASELVSSWLGSFFSLLWIYFELSHSVSFAEYLSLFSFPFSFLLSGFLFHARLWLTHFFFEGWTISFPISCAKHDLMCNNESVPSTGQALQHYTEK